VSLDEHENGSSSSSTSSPEGATPLQKQQCDPDPTPTGCSSVGDGIDFIETILSKIFGCNRADPTATLDTQSVYDDSTNQSDKEETVYDDSTNQSDKEEKSQPPAVDIATPPVIRRLALPDEQEDLKVDRSLTFLFQE
jgi:hypothetical protein